MRHYVTKHVMIYYMNAIKCSMTLCTTCYQAWCMAFYITNALSINFYVLLINAHSVIHALTEFWYFVFCKKLVQKCNIISICNWITFSHQNLNDFTVLAYVCPHTYLRPPRKEQNLAIDVFIIIEKFRDFIENPHAVGFFL